MASNERARVILRVSREDKDGGVVTEERETECAPEDLARHLGESWEVARHGDPPEKALQKPRGSPLPVAAAPGVRGHGGP